MTWTRLKSCDICGALSHDGLKIRKRGSLKKIFICEKCANVGKKMILTYRRVNFLDEPKY